MRRGFPPPHVPRIAHWLDKLQHAAPSLLAVDGKRVVGHAILRLISDAAVGFTIFVRQDSRRQGLGIELTRLAIDLATQMGFAEILLSAEISNSPATSLDGKNGFETKSVYGEKCEMRLATANASRVRDCAA